MTEKLLRDIRDEMLDIIINGEWNPIKEERFKQLIERSMILIDENR